MDALDPDTISNTDAPDLGAPSRQNSQYVDLLLAHDKVPRLVHILVGFFTWIILAGFVIFPGTFNELQCSSQDTSCTDDSLDDDQSTTIALLTIAGTCTAIGAAGMLLLWRLYRKNYVWIVNRIFLPGFLNSFAGVINTVVNVYTTQNKEWNLNSYVTIGVAGSLMLINGALFLIYDLCVLGRIRRSHRRQIASTVSHEIKSVEKNAEKNVVSGFIDAVFGS